MFAIFSSRSLAFCGLGIRAQGRGIELLIELVDFVERFFVSLRPFVIFLLGGVLGVVDFRFRVLRFVVFLEGAIHVDSADFQCLARSSRQGTQARRRVREGEIFS